MTLRVVAKQTWQNQAVRNVFYVNGADTADHTNAQAIVDAFRAAWANQLAASLSTSWQLFDFDVQVVSAASQPVITYVPTLGALGGSQAATGDLPAQVAMLWHFSCPTTRPNRARKYLAGGTEPMLLSGLWSGTMSTGAGDWAAKLLALSTTLALDVTLCTTRLAGTPPVEDVSHTLTVAYGSSIPATIRRRRIGVGE